MRPVTTDPALDEETMEDREMSASLTSAYTLDRRRPRTDRRTTHPLLADWRWAFRGRRRSSRRNGDTPFPDHYDSRLVWVTLAVLILSTLDAALTLTLLDSGFVREANPFMKLLIEHDVQVFINLKTALTAAGLLLMVVAAQTRLLGRIRVRTILYCVLGIYVALIGYELGLIRLVSGMQGMY